MIDHQMISSDWKVQETTFDNGWHIVANFGTDDYLYDEILLPGKGFYASNGSEEVFRIKIQNHTVGFVRLIDRLFLNPYGYETAISGIRTNNAVWLQKSDNQIDLAFIGDQNYVDLNPSLLPWQEIDSEQVFIKNEPGPIPVETLPDGWFRIRKFDNQRFYLIKFKQTSVNTEKPGQIIKDYFLEIHPNPCKSVISIEYGLKKSEKLSLIIYNLLGQRVFTLIDKKRAAGLHRILWNGKDSNGRVADSGIYIIVFKTQSHSKSKKFVLIK